MDEKLLGRAIEYHGPDFLRQLQLEQQNMPPNIFLHLQRHRPHPPEIDDPQFVLNVRRFVSKKADMLFEPVSLSTKHAVNPMEDDEDSYAKMPPLETFMGIDPGTCRRHFYSSLKVTDLVIGIVTSISEDGLVLRLLCMDDDKNRDIDTLRITAFVPVKEIPKMFPTQNPTEGYQTQDFIRGVVVSVNIETENIVVSLSEREIQHREGSLPHLGLVHEEDFPVQYRRKLHIRGLTFDELLNSIMGFTNPGNVEYLLDSLKQGEETSMMRGLHRLKISEKEYAVSLRKQQSQKMAYKNVAQGIAFFKEGRQTEAMQQLNKALQIDAKNVEALVARGALYANNESYNRAIEDFEEALQLNRKHPNAIKYMHETLLAKGKGHEDSGDWDEAETCYKKALEIQPDSVEAKESVRYVQYRKESGKSKSKPERKSYDESAKSPSYQSTTDTLKKLIEVDQRSRKKKSETDERADKRQRSRRYSSSSSSSSSSNSRSRSRSDVGSRSLSQRSRSPRERSPTNRPGRDKRYNISGERELEHGQSSRHQNEDASSEHYSFFKKHESIPFLESSPQNDVVQKSSAEKELSYSRPIDEEDDDLYSGSKYDKPDRKPQTTVKDSSPPVHSSTRIENKPSFSPESRERRENMKSDLRERSVTPTRDEINDRFGLEDISPDLHEEHSRRYDDAKYRGSQEKNRNKKNLHIRKDWSPDEKRSNRGKSPEVKSYDRATADLEEEISSRKRYESDRQRRDFSDKKGHETDSQGDLEPFEERRIVSVRKKNSKGSSKKDNEDYSWSPRDTSRTVAMSESCGGNQRSSEAEEHQERRSIVLSKKPKQTEVVAPEHKETEYIRHLIQAEPLEKKKKYLRSYSRSRSRSKYKSRSRSRGRSGSRSRGRSRSRSRGRSRSRSRGRSRSRSRGRLRSRGRSRSRSRDSSRSRSRGRSGSQSLRQSKKSPERNRRSEKQMSRDTDIRGYEKGDVRQHSDSKESQYRWSKSQETLKVRDQGHYSPEIREKFDDYPRTNKEQSADTAFVISRQIKIDKRRHYSDDVRFSGRENDDDDDDDDNQRQHKSRQDEKRTTTSLTDIFEDLPPPVATKSKITMAFATYVPRSVKLKQAQPHESSLNPESRPPPHSVQPIEPQNRNRNVTEIKDQNFPLSKTESLARGNDDSSQFYTSRSSFNETERTHLKSRAGFTSKSPHERFNKPSSEYKRRSRSRSRTRSPDARSKSTSQYKKRSRSRSKSPVVRLVKSSTYKRSRSRSGSQTRSAGARKMDSSQKHRKHSRSKSGSPESKKSSKKSGKHERISRSRSRTRSPESKKSYSSKMLNKYSRRSRSKSRDKKRSSGRSNRKSRSRSSSGSSPKDRLGRNVFFDEKPKRRSRSDTFEKHKKAENKSAFASSARSRSKSHDRERKTTKSDDISDTSSSDVAKTGKVQEIPTVKSKWDSPEDKGSRWDETKSNIKPLEMPLLLSNIHEKLAATAASFLISSSPPPHRSMRPEEKKKLEEKWKELESEAGKDESLSEQVDIKSSKKFEDTVKDIESQLMANTSPRQDETKGRRKKRRSSEKMGLLGLRSKWDSDSDSSSGRSRGRGRSSESKSDSSQRESSRKSSSTKKSRSRSKSRHDTLPDIVKSAKKDEQRVFWFHKEEVRKGEAEKKYHKSSAGSRGSRKRNKSRSPRHRRSRSSSPTLPAKRPKDDINKNPFKQTTSSETPSKSSRSSERKKSPEKKRDSLQEMEFFLQKLKSEKKKKEQGTSFFKK